jgi:hypothetical protein
MTFSEKNDYLELFTVWKEELHSKKLTPLNLSFIKNFNEKVIKSNSQDTDTSLFSEIFRPRVEYLLQNLISLRRNKILQATLKKEEIETSYLSKQELLYLNFLESSNAIIEDKPLLFSDQLKEYITQNSNVNDFKQNIEKKMVTEQNSITLNVNNISKEEEDIEVSFLKDIDEFIFGNPAKIYGPFKANKTGFVPNVVYAKILQPRGYAKLIN